MKTITTLAAGGLLIAGPAFAQDTQKPDSVAITAHIHQPGKAEPTASRLSDLKLADGFKIEKFAEGLLNPRMLAVSDAGAVYVTRRSLGDVVMLKDTNADGKADEQKVVASRPFAHGITIVNKVLNLVTIKDVYRADIQADGTLGELERIVNDLPDAGQHPNRTIAYGPDGMLYLSVGSTCNACQEPNPENATMLQMAPDGRTRRIYASGLRNTIGFDWHPETGELWGMDHGMDWLGDKQQPEELNLIKEGQQYGWPYIVGDGMANVSHTPPGKLTHEDWRRMSEPMVLGYTAHAAPMQMAFYRGDQFPAEYRGDAFIAMRGSWNAKPAVGFEIVRIDFDKDKPVGFKPFLNGFLEGGATDKPMQFGRPVGLAYMKDGSMLFSDDSGGVIYRVSYVGGATAGAKQGSGESTQMQTVRSMDPVQPAPQPLAIELLKPRQAHKLDVFAAGISQNGAIAFKHSAFGEDISPGLSWSGGPDGTKSFAILMEDPDASMPKPFVHWIAYNITPEVKSLREGLPGTPKLEMPTMLQGRNSAGRLGYFGPKPPDDAVHHYHFQVFALDTVLMLDPGKDRQTVLEAMKDHVLASGEVVGIFRNPQTN
jgi:Raf kinase inhibitor-like YbhB/YbcL family protein